MTEISTPLQLEYRLTESDVHHYCTSDRARKCWRSCHRRKAAVSILAMLVLFLVGMCYQARGGRSASLALTTTLAVLAMLAWSREARADHRVCRLAREMGLPLDLRLIVSRGGIVEESGSDPPDPRRTFAWSEVVDVSRVDHLTVIRLRPAGGVLIVPDRAFPSTKVREGFLEDARAWRAADSRRAAPQPPRSLRA